MVTKLEHLDPAFFARHAPRARAYQLRYLARRSVQLGDGSFAMMLLRDALQNSLRPVFEEPVKTGLTFAAALLARWIKPEQLKALSRRWTGAEVLS